LHVSQLRNSRRVAQQRCAALDDGLSGPALRSFIEGGCSGSAL